MPSGKQFVLKCSFIPLQWVKSTESNTEGEQVEHHRGAQASRAGVIPVLAVSGIPKEDVVLPKLGLIDHLFQKHLG